MDFLKKNYEKVLLGVVLLGLAVAVGFLLLKINGERQKLEDLANSLTNPKIKPLPPLDLTQGESTLKRLATPARLDLSSTNKLFNPVTWLLTKDVPPRLYPSAKAGPSSATVTNITPLYFRITLDSTNVTAEGQVRYVIGVERQAAATRDKQRKKPYYVSLGEQNDAFQLINVQGPLNDPTNLVLILKDTGETNGINKEKAFSRVDGYKADIFSPIEKKSWKDQRVGAGLYLNGEEYKIVAITQNEVVLSAPNQKKWTIRLNSSP
ncbi:MAG TPA: hypothetical protein VLT36_09620 [Candidatus Dormibacteraeota bacterium]|nr:hypothetical protein [Candidatus Dormibacteraeota bacterium]